MTIHGTKLFTNHLDELIKVADKHGGTIKKLKIHLAYDKTCTVNSNQFAKFLKKFPNLVELSVSSSGKLEFVGAVEPVLKVEILSMTSWFCDPKDQYSKFSSFIVSDSLKSLKMNNIENFRELIARQKNLKSITLNHPKEFYKPGDDYDYSIFKHLKLEEFSCNLPSCNLTQSQMLNLIHNHKTLRKIDYSFDRSNVEFLKAICANLHQLQTLHITLTNANIHVLQDVENLKRLEEVTIWFKDIDHVLKISTVDMPSIKKLKIGDCAIYSVTIEKMDIAINLGRHWPNIEELHLSACGFGLGLALQTFPKLKHLTLSIKFAAPWHILLPNRNFGIETLVLTRWDAQFEILPFLKMLPNLSNLKSLTIYCTLSYIGPICIQTLVRMKRLNHLEVSFNADYMPTQVDAIAIKDLCGRVEKFHVVINFLTQDMHDTLRTYLGNNSNCFINSLYSEITLKNFKY